MAGEPYLKKRNITLVIVFILWCISIYIAFTTTSTKGIHIQPVFKSVNSTNSIFAVLSPLMALVLTGFVSSENKAKLVFWKLKNVLPGHRAFSELAPADNRIDLNVLKSKLEAWPTTPKEENTMWYQIYKKHSACPMVYETHGAFLLTRDIAVIALLFAIFGTAGMAFMLHKARPVFLYMIVMLTHYTVFMVAARNYAKRFVSNVLAEHVIT